MLGEGNLVNNIYSALSSLIYFLSLMVINDALRCGMESQFIILMLGVILNACDHVKEAVINYKDNRQFWEFS